MPDTSTITSTSHASQDAQENYSSSSSAASPITVTTESLDDNTHDDPTDLTSQLNHLALHDQPHFMPYIL